MKFISGEPNGIKRGQTVYIRLQLSNQTEAIVLYKGAFYQTTGGNWIYIIDGSENMQ